MKKILITLLVGVFVSGSVFAQQDLFEKAQGQFNSGNYPKAIELLTKIITNKGETLDDAYNLRGLIYSRQEKYDLAIDDILKVQRNVPNFIGSYTNLGWIYILTSQYGKAINILEHGAEISENYTLYLNLAHAHFLSHRDDEAKKLYKKAFTLMPNEEFFEQTVIGDFNLFNQKGLRNDSESWKSWLQNYFNNGAKNYGASNRLYSEAYNLAKEKKYQQAAEKYLLANEFERKTQEPRENIISLNCIDAGFNFEKAKRYDLAAKAFEENLAIEKRIGYYRSVRYSYENLVRNYKLLNQTAKVNLYNTKYQETHDLYMQMIGKIDEFQAGANEAYKTRDSERGLQIATEWHNFVKGKASSARCAIPVCYKILFNERLGNKDKIIPDFESIEKALRKIKEPESIVLVMLPNAGMAYNDINRHQKAIRIYKWTQKIATYYESQEYDAMMYAAIGESYQDLYQYEKAIENFEKAVQMAKENKIHLLISKTYSQMALVYRDWGKYDKALEFQNKIIDICNKIESGDHQYISENFKDLAGGGYDQTMLMENKRTKINSLYFKGEIYELWGRFDDAKKHYQQVKDQATQIGYSSMKAAGINRLGIIEAEKGNYNQAISYYNQAKSIFENTGDAQGLMTILNNLAMAFNHQGDHQKAMNYLEQVLRNARGNQDKEKIASALTNLGNVYEESGNRAKAIQCFTETLEIYRKLNIKPDIALALSNLGAVKMYNGNYDEAVKYFEESIEIIENIRLTATGKTRRDYIARQINYYRFLITGLMAQKNYTKAFEAFELSKAKLLTELLSGSSLNQKTPTIKDVQQSLQPNQAVLLYANIDYSAWDAFSVLVITKDGITGKQLPMKEFVESTNSMYQQQIVQHIDKRRGFKRVPSPEQDQQKFDEKEDDFVSIINYYRSLLQNPQNADKKLFEKLYTFLVKPVEDRLTGKTHITIVPDGILGFLPFETLVMADGKFMAEKYTLSYAQSMSVLKSVSSRTYPASRKPLLAFGGAVYESPFAGNESVSTSAQVNGVQMDFYTNQDNKNILTNEYQALGVGQWSNLPGTLSEVQQITAMISGSESIKGQQVNENYIKNKSETGNLKEYKVLHFATHGIVVPEIPELSALVLSQKGNNYNDGYLTMDEISALDIEADFVNLSACETGLGKIYGGEGIVGLTQSFLLAGAKSLSVSLWQVNDVSTQKFMVNMYQEIAQKGMKYKDAIAEVKKKFIKGAFGEEYKKPYYWAPFVFYGVDNQTSPGFPLNTNFKPEYAEIPPASTENSKIIAIDFETDQFTDSRDGSVYKIIKYGDDWWMAENLRYTNTNCAICPCFNEEEENCNKYGRIYHKTYKDQCPDGWHLASDDDWKKLESILGMNDEELDKFGWRSSGETGKKILTGSSTGFNAMFGGYMIPGKMDLNFNVSPHQYLKKDSMVCYWTSSNVTYSEDISRCIEKDKVGIKRQAFRAERGYYARCVKDKEKPKEEKRKILTADDIFGNADYGNNLQPVSISSEFESGSLTDNRNQTTYKTVKIKDIWWMAENLNYETGSGTWCYQNEAGNCDKFGRLYTWQSAMNACPDGWRLPTKEEFKILIDFHGGIKQAGDKLKKIGYSFNAYLSGCNWGGSFIGKGENASFWSSSEFKPETGYYLSISNFSTNTIPITKTHGYSVRCVKDEHKTKKKKRKKR